MGQTLTPLCLGSYSKAEGLSNDELCEQVDLKKET